MIIPPFFCWVALHVFAWHATWRHALRRPCGVGGCHGHKQYICAFQYNHTGKQYFNVRKNRSLAKIMDTSKQVVRDALPIKCIEAVFLALFLTAGMEELDRFPIGFKTRIDGQVFKHIILAVRHKDKWGALGLSRNADLMFKDLVFDSLSALLTDYRESYEKWWHKVLVIRMGLPVEHSLNSYNQVCWRYLCVKPALQSWEQTCADVDAFAGMARRLWDRWVFDGGAVRKSTGATTASGDATGAAPPTPTSPYLQKVGSPLVSARRAAAAETATASAIMSSISGGASGDGGVSSASSVTGNTVNGRDDTDGSAQPASVEPGGVSPAQGEPPGLDGDESDDDGEEDSSDEDIPLMSPPRGGRKNAPPWMAAVCGPGSGSSSSAPCSPVTKKHAPASSAAKAAGESGSSKVAASKRGVEKGAGGGGGGHKDKGNGALGHGPPSKRHSIPSPSLRRGSATKAAQGDGLEAAPGDSLCSSSDAKDGPTVDGQASKDRPASRGRDLRVSLPASAHDDLKAFTPSDTGEDSEAPTDEADAHDGEGASPESCAERAEGGAVARADNPASEQPEAPRGTPTSAGTVQAASSPRTPSVPPGGQSPGEKGAVSGGKGTPRGASTASPMRRPAVSRVASGRGEGHLATNASKAGGEAAVPNKDNTSKAPGAAAASLAAAKGLYVSSPDKSTRGASTSSPYRQRPVQSSRQRPGQGTGTHPSSNGGHPAKVAPHRSSSGHNTVGSSMKDPAPHQHRSGSGSASSSSDPGRAGSSSTTLATASCSAEADTTGAAGGHPLDSDQQEEGVHHSLQVSVSDPSHASHEAGDDGTTDNSDQASPLHLPQLYQHTTAVTSGAAHGTSADSKPASHLPDRPSSVGPLPPLTRPPPSVSEQRHLEADT
eukprot:jgi/Mesvir1/1870/Mv22906-RA.3